MESRTGLLMGLPSTLSLFFLVYYSEYSSTLEMDGSDEFRLWRV